MIPKKILLLLLLFLLLVSCSETMQKKEVKENVFSEQQIKYDIPDSLYSFFPKKYNEKLMLLSYNADSTDEVVIPARFDILYLIKVYSFSDQSLSDSLIKKYKKIALNSIRAESNDYHIIDSESQLIDFMGDTLLKQNFKGMNIYNTIPRFEHYCKNTPLYYRANKCGLQNGYIISVLKAGNKFVLPEKYKYKWEMLPQKMQHGYLSGVAYNNLTPFIIYWVVAW